MAKGIDHIVWAVHDLEKAAQLFRRLGFISPGQGVHPFGTANYNIQFDHFFIELLGIRDAGKVLPMREDFFSFGRFNQQFLEKREGISMIVLSSEDAEADYAYFSSHGLKCYAPVHFSRMAQLPNGGEAEVAFSLTFVSNPLLDSLGFFCCQHHYPDNFWHREFQQHPNRTTSLKAIDLIVEEPADHIAFFEIIFQATAIHWLTSSYQLQLTNAILQIISPADYIQQKQYHTLPYRPFISGLTFEHSAINELEQFFDECQIPYTSSNASLSLNTRLVPGAGLTWQKTGNYSSL